VDTILDKENFTLEELLDEDKFFLIYFCDMSSIFNLLMELTLVFVFCGLSYYNFTCDFEWLWRQMKCLLENKNNSQ
jgi:hypothetical protein